MKRAVWVRWFLAVTAVAVVADLVAVGLEMWAGWDASANTVPWTELIVTYVPWPYTAAAIAGLAVLCGWLCWHFWGKYRQHIAAVKAEAFRQGADWRQRMDGHGDG